MPVVTTKADAAKTASEAAKVEAAKAAAVTGIEATKADPVLPVAEATEAPAKEQTVWRFVKNWNPTELITFEDGSTYQFKDTEFKTSDKDLAEKLLAVAGQYSIF